MKDKSKCDHLGQNTCEDVPIITFCPKCECLYAIDEKGTRTELHNTVEELLGFLNKKEESLQDF